MQSISWHWLVANHRSVLLNIPFLIVMNVLASMVGLAVYAYYANLGCDPLASKKISNPNQVCCKSLNVLRTAVPYYLLFWWLTFKTNIKDYNESIIWIINMICVCQKPFQTCHDPNSWWTLHQSDPLFHLNHSFYLDTFTGNIMNWSHIIYNRNTQALYLFKLQSNLYL